MVDVLNALLRLGGNPDVIRSRHREISNGKSASVYLSRVHDERS